ncbi:MAG TPA: hypothetical protein VMW71_00035 [Thermoplasmata archaeon]|nr:hypothetical protein [Thermoplasmata archaeon]
MVGMYTDDMLNSVSWWNPVTHVYDSYMVEFGMIDFQLSPGDGMWHYVEISGMLVSDP